MTDEKKTRKRRKKEPERTREQSRVALKRKVRMFYDLQRLRMQVAGRTTPKADGAEIDLHEFDLELLDARAAELLRAEKETQKDVERHLKTEPLWKEVLSDREAYRGLGVTMAAVIISECDIHIEDTPSKMWSFAGLAPVPCRRCKTCQTVLRDIPGDELHGEHPKTGKCEHRGKVLGQSGSYASGKAMRPRRGEKLPYNAFLKTKLLGVLGPCLLKANSPWRSFYDNYKNRWVSQGKGMSDGHRHKAAIRYMVKMLLLDIWKNWRQLEGLEVRPPYQEEYLDHQHVA